MALTPHGYSPFNLFCQPSERMAIKAGWFQSLKTHNNPAYPWHLPPIITPFLCVCVLKIHHESLITFSWPSLRLGGKNVAAFFWIRFFRPAVCRVQSGRMPRRSKLLGQEAAPRFYQRLTQPLPIWAWVLCQPLIYGGLKTDNVFPTKINEHWGQLDFV